MKTRRHFIQVSAAASATVVFGAQSRILRAAENPKPLRILILGGTGFTGPYQIQFALGRGHKITTFNRGKTHPGELSKEVEQLIGDRNGQLDTLKGRQWDVVIDNPTSIPVWVRDAAQVLKANVDRYVFISTISVYAPTSKPGITEDAPLQQYTGPDPMKETRESLIASKFALYGPLKALSETEAEKWFPNKTLIIRPGLIVGPRDETDRFTYWPVRIERGGEVLAPGDPTDPVQFIDARDLAEWTIRMVENGVTGIYNAVGPAKKLGIGEMLNTIKTAENSKANFTWVNADFLAAQKISPWSDMPVWLPARSEDAGLAQASNQRAIDKGLTFRPLADTARDTLAWFKSQPAERQTKLQAGKTAGITPEREAEVLAAWKKRK